MKLFTVFFVFLCVALASAYGQPIVVSEYRYTAPPNEQGVGEWTELLVLDDVVDIRSYLLTDNNSGQMAAQGGVRFRNIDAWRYLRRGTVILIHHRNGAGITEDTDPSDGYLELKPTNMTYFDTVKVTTVGNFPWLIVAMDVAAGGDILELRNSSDIHVHSLSHKLSTGIYYDTIPSPKPNYGGSISVANTSIAIAPGASLADYANANGAQNLATPTQGLPNSVPQNQTLWRTLREPDALRATTMELTANNTFTNLNLKWFASPDTRNEDNTTGYIVLRNTSNSFTPPTDGTTYAPGATLGAATVVANVIGSIDTTYTDNISALTVPCNSTVYYRIYPFRYGTDNPNGNSFNTARGRAYNTISFASGSITKTFPGTATITANGNLAICPGSSVVLEAAPTGNTYQWLKDAAPIAGATNQTFAAVAAGSYTVRVTAPNGCTADATPVSVTLKPTPTATITAVAAQCFRNNSFSFSKTGSTGPGVSFQWDFGIGATPPTSTAETPTGISYNAPGDKLVTLTVTLDGCTTTATRTVRVNPMPSLSIAPFPPICIGDSVRLVASSADGDTYTWTGSNLSATNITNPWAKPTATSQYTVTVQNSTTGCSTSQTVTVTVYPKPRVRIQANRLPTLCVGETITLSDDATSGGQYVWLPDFQTGYRLDLTPTKVGTYIYRLVLTNGNGCKDTSNAITVTVLEKPDATITPEGPTTVCPGGTVTLKANSVPGASYKWSNNATTPEITVGKGTYTVTVRIGSGCDSLSQPLTIVERAPTFSLATRSVLFGDLGACESSAEKTVTITNTGLDDLTFVATASSADFVAPAPFALRAGRATTATLRFTPTAGAGTYTGTLYFTANPCGVLDSIRVEGRKVGSSDVSLALTSVVFPTRISCNNNEQDTVVTIHNKGVQTVQVLSVGIAAPFALTSHTAADFPVLIAPSTSATFRFRFIPTANGTATGNAVFRYESGVCKDSLLLPLSGAFYTPALSVASSALQFASLLGCEDFSDSLLVVTNTGSIPVTVQTAVNPVGEFFVLSHSSPSIAPGEKDTLRLRFRPVATGVRQSTLSITESLCGTTTDITLRGTKQGVSFAATSAVTFAPIIANCSATGSTTAIITLRNTSEQQTTGAVITAILQNASPAFQVVIPSGTVLENKKDANFTITFTPPTDGTFTDTLLVQLQPCNILKTIPLVGVRAQALVSRTSEEVDLAAQPIGNSINAQVLFRNSSTASVPVLAVGGVTPPFVVLATEPPLPTLLQPDSTLSVTVKYTANDTTPDTAYVYLVLDTPCSGTSDSTRLIGNGLFSGQPLPIAIAASLPLSLTGSPGEEFDVPIVLASPSIDTAKITSVETQLSYNGSLLLPLAAAPGPIAPNFTAALNEQRPGVLVLTVTHPTAVLTAEGVLATVRFRVLLGNALSTVLALDTLAVTAPMAVRTTTASGVFTLVDSCDIASRLLDVAGATSVGILEIQRDVLLIETRTTYDGVASLTVYNTLGRTVLTMEDTARKAGIQQHILPTSALPEGVYFLVLRTANTFKTTQFSIIR